MKNLKDYGFNTDKRFYVIAEAGINHGGDIEVAKRLIESAARTGCDAIKFQTYITEKRTPKDSPIFDILKKCELPFEAFKELKDFSKTKDIEFFSTPFDNESVDYLNEIGCDLYKVASFDVPNLKFLEKVASKSKPVILSVGMSNLAEVSEAYKTLKSNTNKIALLHCISAYPTQEKDANLLAVKTLQQEFDCVIGHSDHTTGIKVPLYAAAMGAQVIEKHFMIDENMDCVDKPVSITEKQMTTLVKELRELEAIMGNGEVALTPAQEGTIQFRRGQ